MNKILPIILVVVLSGCGGNVKTPLENCADPKMESDISLDWLDQHILEMSKEEFLKEHVKHKIVQIVGYDFLFKSAKEKEIFIGFLDSSLKQNYKIKIMKNILKNVKGKGNITQIPLMLNTSERVSRVVF